MPSPDAALVALEGRNVVGEEVTPRSLAVTLAVPISLRDIKAAIEEQGVPAGAALSLLSLFGVGLQTYSAEVP